MDSRSPPARHADHRTPLVRNHWYIGALSREVGEALVDRWILDQSVLFYRKRDGGVAALQNRCPHRSYPLSKGTREGDAVVCGYHGLMFGADGRCLRVPSQAGAATNLRTQVYPCVERPPFVWVWMGERAPDADAIPDIPWLDDPGFASVCGVMEAECNYIRLHENVLDLSHLPFLHGSEFADSSLGQARPEVTTSGSKVRVRISMTTAGDEVAAPALAQTHHLDLRFESPALHIARGVVETPADGERAASARTTGYVHAFTPIDLGRTRYFWCVSRDAETAGTAEASDAIARYFTAVFMEDVVGLALVEEMWRRERRAGFQEASIVSDRAGLRMRESLQRLADLEAASARS